MCQFVERPCVYEFNRYFWICDDQLNSFWTIKHFDFVDFINTNDGADSKRPFSSDFLKEMKRVVKSRIEGNNCAFVVNENQNMNMKE
jgi:hypothetical protein